MAKLTREERAIIAAAKEYARRWAPIAPNRCFDNASRIAASPTGRKHGIKYIEGYAYDPKSVLFGRIHHAWNELNGKIEDVTPLPQREWEYFGVQVPTEEVLRFYREGKSRSTLPGHLTGDEFRAMDDAYCAKVGIVTTYHGQRTDDEPVYYLPRLEENHG